MDVDEIYRTSGNVLLTELLGASIHSFPFGEDEEGADRRLTELAEELSQRGRRPFVIPLSGRNPPLGSLGYIRAAAELLSQIEPPEHVVLASGSGQTHAGLLFGLRSLGWVGTVHGICVRRLAKLQHQRIEAHCERIADMLEVENPVKRGDIRLSDDVLAPGYGVMSEAVSDAIQMCARLDGLMTDPVYTGRAMAGLFECVRDGSLPQDSKTLFIHTGGLPALFAYASGLRGSIANKPI